MTKNILKLIPETCKYVSENSTHVKINYEVLDEFIKNIKISPTTWGTSNVFDFMSLPLDTIINFLLVFQSIDFSFWGSPKWCLKTPDGPLDGSKALMYLIIKNISIFTDFQHLESLTYTEFTRIFTGNVPIPLLKERYEILKNIASVVNKKMNGNFYNYIKNIQDDQELFEIIISNFPSFKDERTYKGQKIYMYKLACLLTSDIMHARKLLDKGNYTYSHIPGCTDYKIPQIIRALGITEYSPKLAHMVDNKEPLAFNSIYEVEIRAAAITIINYIAHKTNLCGMAINDYLWIASGNTQDIKPYHLTRTITY